MEAVHLERLVVAYSVEKLKIVMIENFCKGELQSTTPTMIRARNDQKVLAARNNEWRALRVQKIIASLNAWNFSYAPQSRVFQQNRPEAVIGFSTKLFFKLENSPFYESKFTFDFIKIPGISRMRSGCIDSVLDTSAPAVDDGGSRDELIEQRHRRMPRAIEWIQYRFLSVLQE